MLGYFILLMSSGIKIAGSRELQYESLAQCTTREELTRKFQSIVSEGEPDELHIKMVTSHDMTLAVLLAWERTGFSSVPTSGTSRVVSPAALTRFLGFLEGRTRLRVPKWWEYWLAFNYASSEAPRDFLHLRHRATSPVAFKRNGDAFVVYVSDGRETVVRVPEWPEHTEPVVETYNGNLFIVGIAIGGPCDVICCDAATGDRRWLASVWTSEVAGESVASLSVDLSGVTVFGAGGGGNYIEQFDLATGRCKLRFATCCIGKSKVVRPGK